MWLVSGVRFSVFGGSVSEPEPALRVFADVQAQLGFTDAGQYDEKGIEWLTLTLTVPDKPFAVAGARAGDVIEFRSQYTLYNRILRKRGQSLVVPLRRGSQRFHVSVQVPEFEVQGDPDQVCWFTIFDFWR